MAGSVGADRLLGHWPLRGDAQDRSGNDRHGINRGVVLDCLLRIYRTSTGPARHEALGLLAEAMKHRDPGVRRGAAGRLSQVRHPGVRAVLAAAVADADAPTAVVAARINRRDWTMPAARLTGSQSFVAKLAEIAEAAS